MPCCLIVKYLLEAQKSLPLCNKLEFVVLNNYGKVLILMDFKD